MSHMYIYIYIFIYIYSHTFEKNHPHFSLKCPFLSIYMPIFFQSFPSETSPFSQDSPPKPWAPPSWAARSRGRPAPPAPRGDHGLRPGCPGGRKPWENHGKTIGKRWENDEFTQSFIGICGI